MTFAPAANGPGKVSRSTDTGRPGNVVDQRSPEDVTTGVDLIRHDLFWRLGLFEKSRHVSIGIGGHQPKCTWILDPREVQRNVGIRITPRLNETGNVESSKNVAVKDDDGIVRPGLQPRHIADRAPGAQRDFFDDVPQVDADDLLPIAEVVRKDFSRYGFPRRSRDARLARPRDLVLRDGDARDWQHRLRAEIVSGRSRVPLPPTSMTASSTQSPCQICPPKTR